MGRKRGERGAGERRFNPSKRGKTQGTGGAGTVGENGACALPPGQRVSARASLAAYSWRPQLSLAASWQRPS